MPPKSTPIFREVQRFREWRLWFLLFALTLAPAFVFVWGMVQQFVYGRPWGDQPMSDLALALTGLLVIAFSVGTTWMLWAMDLTTEVRDDGDRKSTRLNSSHGYISYAVFCLKKKI